MNIYKKQDIVVFIRRQEIIKKELAAMVEVEQAFP